MCITFFCIEPTTNPEVKLILGFNRQEKTLRNTLSLNAFQEDKNIYGGKDLISGGSWLGLNIQTGVLVFLTNYDLVVSRWGISRGQLVYKFLKTSFIPSEKRNQTDSILYEELAKIAKVSQQYSPFNLTLCNLRTRKTFYLCSQNTPNNKPIELKSGVTHGICNSQIQTIWPKTALGIDLFSNLVSTLGKLKEPEMFSQMKKILKNRQRFSQKDDDESSIFVQPYISVDHVERRTKTTFQLLLLEKENGSELIIKETSYNGDNMDESEVEFTLHLSK